MLTVQYIRRALRKPGRKNAQMGKTNMLLGEGNSWKGLPFK